MINLVLFYQYYQLFLQLPIVVISSYSQEK